MPNPETAPNYIELTTQTYTLAYEHAAAAQKRGLNHAKSHFEILARPFTGSSPDANIREGFDRANQIATITAAELQATVEKNAELADAFLKHAANVQDAIVRSWHGLSNTGLSNLDLARQSANGQIDAFAKGIGEIQEIQKRTAAAAGSAPKS
jgi:hypothetical protein